MSKCNITYHCRALSAVLIGFALCKFSLLLLLSLLLLIPDACKSWTLTAEPQKRVKAMDMRWYRKILRISYKDHVMNEGVGTKIQQAIGPYGDLPTIVKRRKLQWYGHVSRSGQNRLARHSKREKNS